MVLKGLMLLGGSINTIASNDGGGGQPLATNASRSWGGADDTNSNNNNNNNTLVAVLRDELLSWNERIHAALAQVSSVSRAHEGGSSHSNSNRSNSNRISGNALSMSKRQGTASPPTVAVPAEDHDNHDPSRGSCGNTSAHYSPLPFSPLSMPHRVSNYSLPPALMGEEEGDPLNEDRVDSSASRIKNNNDVISLALGKLHTLLEGIRVDIGEHLSKACADDAAASPGGPSFVHCAATNANSAATFGGSVRRRPVVQKSPLLGLAHMEYSQSIAEDGFVTDSFWAQSQTQPLTTTELTKGADATGTKVINQYLIMDTIGQGACGKVKLALDLNRGVTVAMKQVRRVHAEEGNNTGHGLGRKSSGLVAALRREIAIMKKLRHKHIVSLHEVIDDPSAEKLYLVMQYVDQGAVGMASEDGRYTQLSDARVANIVLHVASGLQYLHGAGVVHCDIKPENILMSSEGRAYISDFGVSSIRERATPKNSAQQQHNQRAGGTPLFMPPEAFATDKATSPPSFKSVAASSFDRQCAYDIWALGVTCYALLFGHLPFASISQLQDPTFVPPLSGTVIGENGAEKSLSKKWTLLLGAMLSREPALRPRASQIRGVVKSLKRELNLDAAVSCDPFSDMFVAEEGGGDPTTPIRVRASVRPSWQDLETAITLGSSKGLTRLTSARSMPAQDNPEPLRDEEVISPPRQEHIQPRPPTTPSAGNPPYHHRVS